MIDWDRMRVFRGVAEAGSFTRAAESLGLSQSAISRQISALEEDLRTPLFHRHARGLVLTEQGEILFETAQEMAARIALVETRLDEAKDHPAGHLRINTTVGFGTVWLTAHLREFLELYPEITVSLLVIDTELDLSMREADVAIRLNPPRQPDLIQKRLMTVHTHLYAAPEYLERAPPLEDRRRPRPPPADRLRQRSDAAAGAEPGLGPGRRARRQRAPGAPRHPADQQRLRHAARRRAWLGRGVVAGLPVLDLTASGPGSAPAGGPDFRRLFRLSRGDARLEAGQRVSGFPAAQAG